MIRTDQFTNLPDGLMIAFSSRDDGTMLDRSKGVHESGIVENRRRFCQDVGIDYDDCAYQMIEYDVSATYDLLAEVDGRCVTRNNEDVIADGLCTRMKGVGLFLPVADCIATVLYDERTRQLAMLHLGRHSTLTSLLRNTLRHFEMHGSKMADIRVWMTPSVQRQSYRLEYFDEADNASWSPFIDKQPDGIYIDMQGYNKSICLQAGVRAQNITVSSIDTATDDNYFSHSQGDATGRIAVVAMLTP